MHGWFGWLLGLALLTVGASVNSARSDDSRQLSDFPADVAHLSGASETGRRVLALLCPNFCLPDVSGPLLGAKISLDPKDSRQMDILFSNLIGRLVIPQAAAITDARGGTPSHGAMLSSAGAQTANRADATAPEGGL